MDRSQSSRALLMAILITLGGLVLPTGTSHQGTAANDPNESPGTYDGGLNGMTFYGPRAPYDPEGPCDGQAIMDEWGLPGGIYPDPGAPHIGHIHAIQSIAKLNETNSANPYYWIKEDTTAYYHLLSYENPNLWEGQDNYDQSRTIMLGPDGWIIGTLEGTVYDEPNAPDLWIQDYHPDATYCVYGRPAFDASGAWMFIGSAFIEDAPFYWPKYDTSYDYAFGNSGSPLDLSLFYSEYYNDRFNQPGAPPLKARVDTLLLVASLEKYPAIRSFFTYNTSMDHDTEWPMKGQPWRERKGTETTTHCPQPRCESIWHQDRKDPAKNETYHYMFEWDESHPIVQEHWVDFNETAVRYGWPQRTLPDGTPDLANNDKDPIIGYQWYLDTDPRRDVDTTLQYRDCVNPSCPIDFPNPNPYGEQEMIYPTYYQLLDDPMVPSSNYRTDETGKGYYEACLFTYTQTFLEENDQDRDRLLDDFLPGPNGDGLPDALPPHNTNSPHASFLCQTLVIENLDPVAKFVEPNPPTDPEKMRTRIFADLSYDPDGWPPCVERWIWDMDGMVFDMTIDDYDPNFDPLNPSYTFPTSGTKKVTLTVEDCNGGRSETLVQYVHVPVNEPPVFDPVPPILVAVGAETCFTIDAKDPEGYPLAYITHDGNFPDGMTPEQPPKGNSAFPVCWRPEQDQTGLHSMLFTAEDNLGAKTDYVVLVRVVNRDLDNDNDGQLDILDPCAGGSSECDTELRFKCPEGSTGCQVDWEALCLGITGDTCDVLCPPAVDVQCAIDYDVLCPNGRGVHCERLATQLGALGFLANGQSAVDRRFQTAADAHLVDTDGDGLVDASDNCPTVRNTGQHDLDTDGIGDVCDLDRDGDTVVQVSGDPSVILDNCPSVANADQADSDRDGIGNACDADTEAGRTNLARLEGRVPLDECEECNVPDDDSVPVDATSTGLGTQGILAIVGGVVLLALVSVGLSTWAVRKWRD